MAKSFKASSFFILTTGALAGVAGMSAWQFYAGPPPPRKEDNDFTNDGSSKKRGRQILKYGVPIQAPLVSYYRNHSLHYNQAKKTPSWVAEHLTSGNIKAFSGAAERQKCNFKSDASFPEMFRAKNEDYRGSGWSRGHMAPAGDNKYDQASMNESFLLSNILPQNIDNNAGFWNRFELFCRDLTKHYEDVRIISGPLMLPNGSEEISLVRNGQNKTVTQKFIKYPVVGDSEVAVPTHLFKVIVADKGSKGQSHLGAFIVPNVPISREHKLSEYQVKLEEVEKRSGFELLPGLDQSQTRDLCADDGCQLMSFEKFEMFFIGRRIQGATTLNRLEKAWSELKIKELTPDKAMTDAYNEKKKQLSQQ